MYFKVIDYDGNEYHSYDLNNLRKKCIYNNIKIMDIWGDDDIFDGTFILPQRLKVFKCESIINIFPELPDTLEELECINNGINWTDNSLIFPKLPDGLKIFRTIFNRIWFPPELPNSLVELNLSCNGLICLCHDKKGFNKRLPDNLEKLIVDGGGCSIFGVGVILPPKLKYLSCRHSNGSVSFVTLPDSLLEFDCSCSRLTHLPKLPPNLKVFECINNSIKELPTLPLKLERLSMMDNAITSINLPDSVELQKNLKDVCMCGNRVIKLPDNILRYAKTDFNFARNPIEILFSKQLKSDRRGYDHQNYIRVINAVHKIENWYLNARYNPNHNYCKRKLMEDYNELYDERSNKRLKLF